MDKNKKLLLQSINYNNIKEVKQDVVVDWVIDNNSNYIFNNTTTTTVIKTDTTIKQ